jgi:hypothetical protein
MYMSKNVTHASVFKIINHNQFAATKNRKRGMRWVYGKPSA